MNNLLSFIKPLIRSVLLVTILFLFHLILTPSSSLASQECSSRQYDSADNYARTIVTEKLLFLSPVSLRKKVNDCKYFPAQDTFLMYMTINWYHPWEENKYYEGYVKLTSQRGRLSSWNILDQNWNLVQHILTMGLINVIADTATTSNISFLNSCHEDIDVAIIYHDGSNWIAKGWWNIDGQKKVKTTIKTNINNIYFYGKSDNYTWDGRDQSDSVNQAIVSNKFSYNYGEAVSGDNRRTVSFFRHKVNFGTGESVHTFSCN